MEKSEKESVKRLAQLREDLRELKATLPEHCAGTREYISVHRATPAHWQKIEEIEEEIKALESRIVD